MSMSNRKPTPATPIDRELKNLGDEIAILNSAVASDSIKLGSAYITKLMAEITESFIKYNYANIPASLNEIEKYLISLKTMLDDQEARTNQICDKLAILKEQIAGLSKFREEYEGIRSQQVKLYNLAAEGYDAINDIVTTCRDKFIPDAKRKLNAIKEITTTSKIKTSLQDSGTSKPVQTPAKPAVKVSQTPEVAVKHPVVVAAPKAVAKEQISANGKPLSGTTFKLPSLLKKDQKQVVTSALRI